MFTWLRKTILAVALAASLVPAFAQSPTPVPALPDVERRTSYTITNSTCACSLGPNLQLYGDGTDYQNWVEVWLNGTQIQYNDPVFGWTITSPSGPIGNLARPITNAVLTFNNPQTGTVQIVGARRPRRVSQFNENAGVSARNLNQVITDIVAMLREAWDKINDVTGRVIMAPPGETMQPLPPASQRANLALCFNGSGEPVPCAITSSGSVAAGTGISVAGADPTTISTNLQVQSPLVLSGTAPQVISCPTCTAASGGATFVPTRVIAQSLNLSAYNVVMTGGYSAAGDGGVGIFQNIGSAPFIDSQVLTGTVAGSSCTNGTYLGVNFTGSATGTGLTGNITVSSGFPTVVLSGNQGNAYKVGDVLSQSAFTCSGTPFSYTVATISNPVGSFTDLVGNHFQYQPGVAPVNVLAFGVKADWNSSTCPDACATNNFAPLEAALQFAGYRQLNGAQFDSGNAFGRKVQLPSGVMMICGSSTPFQWYQGTDTGGQGFTSTEIKICDSGFTASTNIFTICDPTSHLACILTRVHDFEVFEDAAPPANSDIAVWYSNNVQQSNVMERIFTFSGLRTCINWDTGYGGAAIISVEGGECQPNAASVNPAIIPNYSAAVQTFRDMVVETAVSNTNFGFLIGGFAGGAIVLDGIHFEGLTSPIQVQPGANVVINIHNITGGNSCGSLITRQNGSTSGVTNAGALFPNGCTNTLNNAGATTSGIIVADHQM